MFSAGVIGGLLGYKKGGTNSSEASHNLAENLSGLKEEIDPVTCGWFQKDKGEEYRKESTSLQAGHLSTAQEGINPEKTMSPTRPAER